MRFVPMAFLTIFMASFVTSCTMDTMPMDTGVTYASYNERTDGLPLAGQMGLNVDLMDSHIDDLVVQTKSIQKEIDDLMIQLLDLQKQIAQAKDVQSQRPVVLEPVAIKKIVPPKETVVEKLAVKPVVQKQSASHKSIATIAHDGVYNVRFGKHRGKTRMVFDVNGPLGHNVSFDKEAGLVTIILPKTQWNTKKQKILNFNQIDGYEAQAYEGGAIIALSVKNTTRVKSSVIKPSANKNGRIVVDFIR